MFGCILTWVHANTWWWGKSPPWPPGQIGLNSNADNKYEPIHHATYQGIHTSMIRRFPTQLNFLDKWNENVGRQAKFSDSWYNSEILGQWAVNNYPRRIKEVKLSSFLSENGFRKKSITGAQCGRSIQARWWLSGPTGWSESILPFPKVQTNIYI